MHNVFKLCKHKIQYYQKKKLFYIFSPKLVHKSNGFAALTMWICYNKFSFQIVSFGGKKLLTHLNKDMDSEIQMSGIIHYNIKRI